MRIVAYGAMVGATAMLASTPVAADDIFCPPGLGAVTVDNVVVNGSCQLSGTTVEGNVFVEIDGDLLAQGARVDGNVQSDGAIRVRLMPNPMTGAETTVGGSVQLDNVAGPDRSRVIDARINGDLQLVSNRADFDLTGNTIGADLQAFQNEGLIRIGGNTIDGNLQCKENTPAPIDLGGNVVSGNAEDQCAGFAN